MGIGVQIAPFCSPTLDRRHDFKKQCPRCIGDETCLMGNQNSPLNIVRGERLYINGGAIFNQNIFGPNKKLIALLDVEKSGFFLGVKGQARPGKHHTHWQNFSVFCTETSSDSESSITVVTPDASAVSEGEDDSTLVSLALDH